LENLKKEKDYERMALEAEAQKCLTAEEQKEEKV
jgi:hypothetical protein